MHNMKPGFVSIIHVAWLVSQARPVTLSDFVTSDDIADARDLRIVGGEDAPRGFYTWMAQVRNYDDYSCGGALVSTSHVITAKHCVETSTLRKGLNVVLGDHQRSVSEGTEQTIEVKKVTMHEDLDVAILILKHEAILNDHVTVLPMAEEELPDGTVVHVTGWGLTNGQDKGSVADKLQMVPVQTLGRPKCTVEGLFVSDHLRCIGTDGPTYMNVCHGDSGGPVVANLNNGRGYELVGVVYGGHFDCPDELRNALMTRTGAYLGWALDVAGCHIPGVWTGFFNEQHPTRKHKDDREKWKKYKTKPCGHRQPLCTECKIVPEGVCAYSNGSCVKRQVFRCNRAGLTCRKKWQKKIKVKNKKSQCPCCDYSVRFKCPLS